jgi:hypothetical protein
LDWSSFAMSATSSRVIGIAWYREESYERIMALMADGASFPKTYASWRHKAVRMERELKRQGLKPVRVEVDPAAFQQWCERRGAAPDSEARNQFVEMEVARQAVGSG